MQKTISKNKIIEALKTETLVTGSFIRLYEKTSFGEIYRIHDESIEIGKAKSCEVCAVGSILRKLLPPTTTLSRFADFATKLTKEQFTDDHDYKKLLKQKNYFGALSVYFEQIERNSVRYLITKKERTNLIRFVQRNFPERVRINL